MSRPNILVIQADQLTSLCLSAYGKPYAITPNIDKMAAERHNLHQQLLQQSSMRAVARLYDDRAFTFGYWSV